MSYPPVPPQSQYQSLLQGSLPPYQSTHSSAPPPLPPLPPAAQQAQWSTVAGPSMPHAQQQQVTGNKGPDYPGGLRSVAGVPRLDHGAPPSPIPSPAQSPRPGSIGSHSHLFMPPVLQSKNRQELAALIQDEETLTALFQTTHPAIAQHLEKISALSTQVKETTSRILDKEKTIADARARTESELKDAQDMDAKWREVEKRMYDALAPYSSARLRVKLGSATEEAEHVSEALAGSFLDIGGASRMHASAGVDVGQFVREYRRVRRIYHLRKERLDRWNEERVGGAGRVRRLD
ncbi:uncharacterized protein V1513DRAFT_447820 [Lipomyces chichibuensis]|uniref:uncharacterized protein n=1 Tax=Lipomyces chichibuensis TaxID=1546026 RepID=UPI0033431DAA